MLFGFEKIQNDAEGVINKWIEAYEQRASAFDLYFLAKMGRQTYLEERFLALAQGLEAYFDCYCRVFATMLRSLLNHLRRLLATKINETWKRRL